MIYTKVCILFYVLNIKYKIMFVTNNNILKVSNMKLHKEDIGFKTSKYFSALTRNTIHFFSKLNCKE